jgi:hypothetical protein
MIWIIHLLSIGRVVLVSKKKKNLAVAEVIYKYDAWTVKVNGEKIGRASSLINATHLLYTNGYKVYAYRRGITGSGRPKFTADCLVFDYEKENE